MQRKEFVNLIESNMRAIERMSGKIKARQGRINYSHQQIQIIVRLYMSGAAKLKDIAARELTPASNLCASFRRLEKDGLVCRKIDESDRRDTWYSVTKKGAGLAELALDLLRERVSEFFSGISRGDEARLTAALKTINEILNKMEK
jgi:DNA-binding MarR family transcriptional regulator